MDEAGENLPIIAGCNHSNIEDVKDLMKHAAQAGAAGVMVLSPYYYVPTDDAVLRFYKEISKRRILEFYFIIIWKLHIKTYQLKLWNS